MVLAKEYQFKGNMYNILTGVALKLANASNQK